MAAQPSSLGYGLLTPFQRDRKNDFANGGGDELLRAAARQVLGTRRRSQSAPGELRWRDDFGSLLERLRHMNPGYMLDELARHYVADAFAQWDARLTVISVTPIVSPQTKRVYELRVLFAPPAQNVAGAQVSTRQLEVSVPWFG